jgi:hypothetical protein
MLRQGEGGQPVVFEIYGAKTLQDLRLLKKWGFTQVILDPDPKFALTRAADRMGLRVVMANWWKSGWSWNDVQTTLATARTLKNLVSINMMDEPCRDPAGACPPSVYQALRRRIRRAWPGAPLSLTIYGPDPNWKVGHSGTFLDYLATIDVLRIDPYPPAAGKPLGTVYHWVEQARLLMREARRVRPLTVILQAWSDPKSNVALPSVQTIRAMAYVAMLSGVRTLSFFKYDPTDWAAIPYFLDDFRDMMAELVALAKDLEGARTVALLGGDETFQAEVRKGKKSECITVNLTTSLLGGVPGLGVVRAKGACPRT